MATNQECYTYKGVVVRKGLNNRIYLRLDEQTFISLIDESERTNMPIAELVRVSSKPCSYCKVHGVVAQNIAGEYVTVQRGLICQPYKKQNSGSSIINQHNKKNGTIEQQPTGIDRETDKENQL